MTESMRVSLHSPENNVSASPEAYSNYKGPELAVDRNLGTSFHQPEGNHSTLTFQLTHPRCVTGVSITSCKNEDRKSDPASFLIEGLESNNSFTAITEEFVPAFGEPRKPQIISFDSDRNFSTYRITLNNESDFNGSCN